MIVVNLFVFGMIGVFVLMVNWQMMVFVICMNLIFYNVGFDVGVVIGLIVVSWLMGGIMVGNIGMMVGYQFYQDLGYLMIWGNM